MQPKDWDSEPIRASRTRYSMPSMTKNPRLVGVRFKRYPSSAMRELRNGLQRSYLSMTTSILGWLTLQSLKHLAGSTHQRRLSISSMHWMTRTSGPESRLLNLWRRSESRRLHRCSTRTKATVETFGKLSHPPSAQSVDRL